MPTAPKETASTPRIKQSHQMQKVKIEIIPRTILAIERPVPGTLEDA
jgi:hypothetical protein